MEDRLQVYAGKSLILWAFGHDRAEIVRALLPGLAWLTASDGELRMPVLGWLDGSHEDMLRA